MLLQALLRAALGDAEAWEALGAAYQALGRFSAALKVGLRRELSEEWSIGLLCIC